ncbi:hypothetical protein PR202_gb18257 [Eleusine coracana subsp. coracana]|uniref:Uncharacterized protein n=1 Tax=Eleusine coracana subsp. coracana TaxID=191504 RepID=A0AAV5F6M9_ELECO|nr:hypothetical protein PR202_gb18257 [Eleusine coracana subsp. coracana]
MPPPRPSSRRRRITGEPPPGLFPAGDDLLRLLFVLFIAAAVATLCSLLNRRPQPFCDFPQSLDATDYNDAYAKGSRESRFPFADSCEPCPHNGQCVDGELECIQGFKRYGRKCVEDGMLSQTANKIVLPLSASTPAPAPSPHPPFFFLKDPALALADY